MKMIRTDIVCLGVRTDIIGFWSLQFPHSSVHYNLGIPLSKFL